MRLASGQPGSLGTKASARGGSSGAGAQKRQRAGTARVTAPFRAIRRVYILPATAASLRSGPCSHPLCSPPPLPVLAGDGVVLFCFLLREIHGDETLTSPSLILILCRVGVDSGGFREIQRGNSKSLVDLRFPLCPMVISARCNGFSPCCHVCRVRSVWLLRSKVKRQVFPPKISPSYVFP
jgi:hypothetical protein